MKGNLLKWTGVAAVAVTMAGCAALDAPAAYDPQAWIGKPVAQAEAVFGKPSASQTLANGSTSYAWYGLYDRTVERPFGNFIDPGYGWTPGDFYNPDFYPPIDAFGNPMFDGEYPYGAGLPVTERRLVKCKVGLTAMQGVITSFQVQNLTTPNTFMAGGCDNFVQQWVATGGR